MIRSIKSSTTVAMNRDPFVIADRLWVKDILDPEEERLRFSK